MSRNVNLKNDSTCNIKFDGYMTLELQGKVTVEIVKSLIYQRGQVPLPFDQLKRFVENELLKPRCEEQVTKVFQDTSLLSEVTTSEDARSAKACTLNIPPQIVSPSHRKVLQSYELYSKLFEHLNVIIGNAHFNAKELAMLVGGTQITPQEFYHIILPAMTEPLCATHEAPKLTLKACMVRLFKTVVTNGVFWDSSSNSDHGTSLSNMMVLVKMNRNSPMSDHMEPQLSFQIPSKAKKFVAMPIYLSCSECEENEAGVIEDSFSNMSLACTVDKPSDESDFIWVKVLPTVKGFSSSLLGKPTS